MPKKAKKKVAKKTAKKAAVKKAAIKKDEQGRVPFPDRPLTALEKINKRRLFY